MSRVGQSIVVYKAELGFVDPEPLDWTDSDCADVPIQKY